MGLHEWALLLSALVGIQGHPLAPTCHGFGGVGASCAAAKPGDSGKRRGSSLGGKTLAVRVEVSGCYSKPCWLQNIRVGMDESNAVESPSKVGVYLSDGRLVASSQVLPVPTALPDNAWLSFPLRGHDKELRTLQELDHVWLVFNTPERVQLTYENVGSAEEATRYVSEDFSEAFAEVRSWGAQQSRQWAGHFRNLRMQMDLGDVSILPGTLPLILEAPHGGRIEHGWPERVSGTLSPDLNTDLLTEELWQELGARCAGRTPVAVILRVHRQGIDANRITGNATVTHPGNEPCSKYSNGQCCCDLADPAHAQMAMTLNDVYHGILADKVAEAAGALLVPVHATGRHRVELGLRLSASDLNSGAALVPPSLQEHDSDCSLRALGDATTMTWGPQSLGAFLKSTRPLMEVVPSPELHCPDAGTCPGSSYSQLFMGGHNLKIHVSGSQPGMQMELPKEMRGFWNDPPAPEAAAVKQVAASLASFLNAHLQETCETDVNFGLACGVHGVAMDGICVCNVGYVGDMCADCAEGYLLVDGQCVRLVLVGPPSGATQKYASLFDTTSSGKRYVYTRKFDTDLSGCGNAGCRPLNMSLRVRCDSAQCHSDLDDAAYTIGAALYDESGQRLCSGTVSREAQSATDWWLQLPLPSCPLLYPVTQAIYLATWTSKKVKVRWEKGPVDASISRGLQFRTTMDALPPAQLPSWRDLPCEGPNCNSESSCDCISGCTCRSWSGDFYGLIASLSLQTMGA